MFSNNRKSQAGFSLVELMVVVAIIGVLASIAVPSINKYMAKARQSEAKTNLGSLYTAEKAFFSEYSVYDSRFGAVGYSPEGSLRYNLGFTGGTNAGPANGYTANPAVANVAAKTLCLAYSATVNCTMLNGATNVAPPDIDAAMCPASGAAAAGCTTTATSFQAGAGARISSNSGVDDYWAIDHTKNLRNTVDGIR